MVKLSVCIPVYNGAEYVEEAIRSVLNQSFTDYELIVIDNCSTDDTCAVVTAITDPRIKLYKNDTNLGLVGNWNKALTLASGKYIKILPADDFIYPDALALQVAVLDADTNQQVALVCGRKNVINSQGKILFNRGFANSRVEMPGKSAINKVVSSGGNIIGEAGAVLFRKSIIEKAGLFSNDIFYVLDLDLFFRMLCHGNLVALPDVISSFRVSKSSSSVHVADKQLSDIRRFYKKIYNDKAFGLSQVSYKQGLFKASLLTMAKKVIYRFSV